MINLPLAHSSYYGWRLDRDGVDTVATVVDTRRVPPDAEDGKYVVEFRFDADLDPEQKVWFAQVDAATYDRAAADAEIGVRVLPDRPGTYEADGQEKGSLPWVITLIGDVLLFGLAFLYWRFRPTGKQLHLVAVADVERCKPLASIERLDDGRYVVCGEVERDRGRRDRAGPRRPDRAGGARRARQRGRVPTAGARSSVGRERQARPP